VGAATFVLMKARFCCPYGSSSWYSNEVILEVVILIPESTHATPTSGM
jgi:hypothetical protein